MIILVIVAFVIFYFVIRSIIHATVEERISSYAQAVDSVFFDKDKRIEELEDRINDMQLQMEKLRENNK